MEKLSENNDNMLIIENVNNFNITINLKNEHIFLCIKIKMKILINKKFFH